MLDLQYTLKAIRINTPSEVSVELHLCSYLGRLHPRSCRSTAHVAACALGLSSVCVLSARLRVRLESPSVPSPSGSSVTPPSPPACHPNLTRTPRVTTTVSNPLVVSTGFPPPLYNTTGGVALKLQSTSLTPFAHVGCRRPPPTCFRPPSLRMSWLCPPTLNSVGCMFLLCSRLIVRLSRTTTKLLLVLSPSPTLSASPPLLVSSHPPYPLPSDLIPSWLAVLQCVPHAPSLPILFVYYKLPPKLLSILHPLFYPNPSLTLYDTIKGGISFLRK